MKLLLDTHALLWWLHDPGLLSKEARTSIREGKNVVYVSAAVVWEIVIKRSVGKLDAPEEIEEVLRVNRFVSMPITVAHVLALQVLPVFHSDPFDRILVAQAIAEGLTLITRDPQIQRYSAPYIVA